MVNPVTVNLGIIIPLTGADIDTWGEDDINPNMVALDGLLGGVQTIGLTNAPVTLTAPAGFVATPSPGPTQSQNRVLRFTGALTGNVRVTLPLPGAYLIDNRTTGNFVVSFQGATATEVIAVDQGSIVEVYNDGANVRFVNLGRVGQLEFWGGISAIPAWVTACTVKPYLYCDDTIYNFADFPWLAAKYQGQFGGNGLTTFGVQDLRGRVPLAYDGTGTRITTALCGINGQTMGAAGGIAGEALVRAHLPNQVVSVSIADPGHGHPGSTVSIQGDSAGSLLTTAADWGHNNTGVVQLPVTIASAFTGITASLNLNGGVTQTVLNNMQPSQVSGIWVVKT